MGFLYIVIEGVYDALLFAHEAVLFLILKNK
jgi:hypothetical protein